MSFQIKANRKEGECAAKRCKAPAEDFLCPDHEKAWKDEGSPALVVADKKTKAKDAAPQGLTLSIPDSVQSALTEERNRTQRAIQLAKSMQLETQEQVDRAGLMIGKAQTRLKQLEVQRTSVTQPLNGVLKEVNSWFRPVKESLTTFVSVLDARMKARIIQGEKDRDAALSAIEAGGGKASAENLLLAHSAPTAPANITLQKGYTGKVTNFAILDDKYKMLNEKALQAAIDAGERDIAGVLIEEEYSTIKRGV